MQMALCTRSSLQRVKPQLSFLLRGSQDVAQQCAAKKVPEKWQSIDWFSHHDIANVAITMTLFMARNGMVVLPHQPFSPDMTPRYFFYSQN